MCTPVAALNPTPATSGVHLPNAWPGCATCYGITIYLGGWEMELTWGRLQSPTALGYLTEGRRRIRWVGITQEGPCGRGCGLDPLTQAGLG